MTVAAVDFIAALRPSPMRCLHRQLFIDWRYLRAQSLIPETGIPALTIYPDDFLLLRATVTCAELLLPLEVVDNLSALEVDGRTIDDEFVNTFVANAPLHHRARLAALHRCYRQLAPSQEARFSIIATSRLIESRALDKFITGQITHHPPLSHSWGAPAWWELEPPGPRPPDSASPTAPNLDDY